MTQQYSQKYTVVCFFEPQATSTNFSALDWPLHITMLDTFKTKWPISILCDALNKVAASIAPFDTVPTQKVMLGENRDVPVKLMRLEGALTALHSALLGLVAEGSFVFNTPEFVGKGFLPHATDQDDNQVEIGKPYRMGGISLIDMFPDNDHMRREVVDSFSFKH